MEKRLYAIRLLSYWALIEIAITMVVLFKKGHHQDFPDNYLHGFCDNNACQMVIVKSLYVKLASAILLFLGCIWESGMLIVPWVVINLTGMFPLTPLLVSSFVDYKDIKHTLAIGGSVLMKLFK